MKGKKHSELSSKLLYGNKDRKRYQKSKVLTIYKPNCPRGLLPRAKAHWAANADNWFRMGKLNQFSIHIFEKICIIYGKMGALEEKIGEDVEKMYQKTYFVDPSGTEHLKYVESVESKMLRLYYSQYRAYMKDAGISPSETKGIFEFVREDDEEEDEEEF